MLSKPREALSLGYRKVGLFWAEFANLLKKWRQEPTARLTIIILIISAVVATFAAYTEYKNFQFEQQARLTALIQQLSEARGKIVELQLQYDTEAPIPSIGLRQSLIEEAIKPDSLVRASSFQKMIIAESLNDTNQPDQAERIAGEAESAANNRLERVLAAQVRAVAYFNQGNPVEGRRAYSRALAAAEVTEPTGKVDRLVKALYKLDTEQFWISSELRVNDCLRAKERLGMLEAYREDFPKALADEFERRVGPTRAIVAKFCP